MFAEGFAYGQWVTIGVIALIAVLVLWFVRKFIRHDD
jgi:hypothetical protein